MKDSKYDMTRSRRLPYTALRNRSPGWLATESCNRRREGMSGRRGLYRRTSCRGKGWFHIQEGTQRMLMARGREESGEGRRDTDPDCRLPRPTTRPLETRRPVSIRRRKGAASTTREEQGSRLSSTRHPRSSDQPGRAVALTTWSSSPDVARRLTRRGGCPSNCRANAPSMAPTSHRFWVRPRLASPAAVQHRESRPPALPHPRFRGCGSAAVLRGP